MVLGLVAVSAALRPHSCGPWLSSVTSLGSSTASNATIGTIDRAIPSLPQGMLALVVVGGATVVLVIWWVRTRPLFARVVAAALCLSLALAPHGWSYDLTLLLVSSAVVRESLAHEMRGRRCGGVAFLGLLTALTWPLYALAPTRGGEESSVVVPLALFLLVIATARWARERRERDAHEAAWIFC